MSKPFERLPSIVTKDDVLCLGNDHFLKSATTGEKNCFGEGRIRTGGSDVQKGLLVELLQDDCQSLGPFDGAYFRLPRTLVAQDVSVKETNNFESFRRRMPVIRRQNARMIDFTCPLAFSVRKRARNCTERLPVARDP